ncbi:phosphatase PAP2 family protein [Sporosarcina oncorhynchi]|uniref:Phosphatase PAP2 family protein n=1 Tax=Sporosarcina oncorhynchi TaxID=3056444 RepID=A0ABZ0L5N0_9BACL|nr:phosphatase PAP2 family protein [Sporosarcina sp. T2O-4]WOV87408.1 phosphatase PAP2 family protein [Sporosarcina sp. T2O-4]
MKILSARLILALVLCILFGGVFAYIARSISLETINDFDSTIINIVQGWEADWLTPIMKVFTFIGSTKFVLFLIAVGFAILLFAVRNRAEAFLFFIALGGTGALNQTLKFIFKRERPDIHRLIEETGFSFPSGHTMMAFSLYAVIAYLLWRHIRTAASKVLLLFVAIFMFAMIGISRIYLGVHYPSDIAGGVAASAFWMIIAISVYGYVLDRRKRTIAK